MTTERKNFSNEVTPSIIDTDYVRCNFTQTVPVDMGGGVIRGVRIFPGDDTPRTFTDCNLCNAEPPPGSTLVRCNTTIKTFHVPTFTEEDIIDGEPYTIQHHSDFIYGRLNPDTLAYEDNPAPIEYPEPL